MVVFVSAKNGKRKSPSAAVVLLTCAKVIEWPAIGTMVQIMFRDGCIVVLGARIAKPLAHGPRIVANLLLRFNGRRGKAIRRNTFVANTKSVFYDTVSAGHTLTFDEHTFDVATTTRITVRANTGIIDALAVKTMFAIVHQTSRNDSFGNERINGHLPFGWSAEEMNFGEVQNFSG